MKHILPIILILFLVLPVNAMDVRFKECLQRGYTTKSDPETGIKYCILPNGTLCTLEEFNIGKCGKEYLIEDYCVEKGNYVWDDDMCCNGTESYLKEGGTQARCLSIDPFTRIISRINPYPFVIVALSLLIFFTFWTITHRKRKVTEKKIDPKPNKKKKKNRTRKK